MITTREWPVRAMYILIAAALALGLFLTVAPAHQVSANSSDVTSEWGRVSTPTTQGFVLAPQSYIVDQAVVAGGDTAYSILYQTYTQCQTEQTENLGPWYLLKSTDGAATWTDITKGVTKEIDKKHLGELTGLLQVACDAADPDFLAVALSLNISENAYVFLSDDGGATFRSAGEVDIPTDGVFALEVSPAVSDVHDIAIGGTDWSGNALLFRATTDSIGVWEDATADDGWNDQGQTTVFSSVAVVAIQFSPSWQTDHVILVATANNNAVQLQSGTWGETPAWNKASSLGINAVHVIDAATTAGISIDWGDLEALTAGITLPQDYNGQQATTRYAWVWVNYFDDTDTPVGKIFVVNNANAAEIRIQIPGTPWLTDVSYLGTIAEGKAIAGLLGDGTGYLADCCAGVQVYRHDNITTMNVCCTDWAAACDTKLPTGIWAMAAFYVSDTKAYAVALGPENSYYDYDEGAWSVSFDDPDYGVGYIWDQLSLIDTQIDYLSDVAVSPDCNKMILVSVNLGEQQNGYCACDSVWLKATNLPEAPEYSGKWLRTWCGQLGDEQYGLLRLPPASVETTGDTVYLVDRGTNTIYLNDLETLGCWTKVATPTVKNIVDLAVSGNETLYALDTNGNVALYDAEGWHASVDSDVDTGWTIAVHGDDVLVGGTEGQVSYSPDEGQTFNDSPLEETPTIDGYVTVAFDSYFDTNNVIYAATAGAGAKNGIYRWVIGTSTEWKDLNAEPFDYTGLVLGFQGGNPFSNKDTGGVLYASYIGDTFGSDWSSSDDYFNCWKGNAQDYSTGVARCLTPAAEISCEKCIEWDYLTVGLTGDESFLMMPQALKICGCTDFTTTPKLYAIGTVESGYDMCKAKEGTVWTFEDCYAKQAPELLAPPQNTTIQADCYCNNLPFSLTWSGVCDACYYDVQIALDPAFTDVVAQADYTEGGKDILGATGLSFVVPGDLTCQVTYYWRVRAHEASTCQIIHSWWSDAGTITVAPNTAQGAITMSAPVSGANDVAVKNVGFTWNLQATANKFVWKLSTDPTFSSTVNSQTLTTTAYNQGTLSYNTTYYWQVTAYKDSTLVSTSPVGTFRTIEQPTTPTPTTQATPTWVWVVIAIGAVLVIVVIVLIFRTRRV
ncbi:MAG: hypothetical protein ABSF21_01810 [Dehalococcoidia bacterium]